MTPEQILYCEEYYSLFTERLPDWNWMVTYYHKGKISAQALGLSPSEARENCILRIVTALTNTRL